MKHETQTPAVDILIVRRKSLTPTHADYNKWESLLTPGHWVPITWKYIQTALAQHWHVLWNPETKLSLTKRRVA